MTTSSRFRSRPTSGVRRRIVRVTWRNPIKEDRSDVLLSCGHIVPCWTPAAREAWCHPCGRVAADELRGTPHVVPLPADAGPAAEEPPGTPTSASLIPNPAGGPGAATTNPGPAASPDDPEQVAEHRKFMALFGPQSMEMDGWPVSPIVYGASAPSRFWENAAHFAGALLGASLVAGAFWLLLQVTLP